MVAVRGVDHAVQRRLDDAESLRPTVATMVPAMMIDIVNAGWVPVYAVSRIVEVCGNVLPPAAGGVLWYHWLGLEQGFKEDRRRAPVLLFFTLHRKVLMQKIFTLAMAS